MSILPDELGIRFNGSLPPHDLWDKAQADGDMNNVRVRMTGTIKGDGPMVAKATVADPCVPDAKRAIINKGNKYGHREVFDGLGFSQWKSEFSDRVQSGALQARVQDDYRELLMMAARSVTIWSRSRMSGNFKISHLDWQPPVLFNDPLGTSVDAIIGRGIDLTGRNLDYPEITKMTYNFTAQYIQCELDRPRLSPLQAGVDEPPPTGAFDTGHEFSDEPGLGTGFGVKT